MNMFGSGYVYCGNLKLCFPKYMVYLSYCHIHSFYFNFFFFHFCDISLICNMKIYHENNPAKHSDTVSVRKNKELGYQKKEFHIYRILNLARQNECILVMFIIRSDIAFLRETSCHSDKLLKLPQCLNHTYRNVSGILHIHNFSLRKKRGLYMNEYEYIHYTRYIYLFIYILNSPHWYSTAYIFIYWFYDKSRLSAVLNRKL